MMQLARARAMQQAYLKHLKNNPRENAPTAGEIRSLGLLKEPPAAVHMKLPKYIPTVKPSIT